MKLTSEQYQKLVAYVQSKWKAPYRCASCEANQWSVPDELFQLMQYTPGSIAIGGPVIPFAPVTCTNCGNTILINAIIAGLVDQTPKEDAGKEKVQDNG